MLGIDISNYQKGINLSAGKYDFAIIKASEGHTFIDKSFFTFAKQLTELKKCIGAYHYARPDYGATTEDMKKEAHNFISCVNSAGLIGRAILALDWEEKNFINGELATVWLEEVEKETGTVPFIYMSYYMIEEMCRTGLKQDKYPIWVAKWSKGDYDLGSEPPSDDAINFSFNRIWQYTSNGKYPGWKGRIDLDYTPMTKEFWEIYALSSKKEEAAQEKLSSDMTWAINQKLFIGDGYGRYLPKEPLTREQAATVLKRFYDLITKMM